MRKNNFIFLAIAYLLFASCSTEKHKFPLDKRYWDVNDYDNVVRELRFGYKNDEILPTFDNPETRIIVEKLTDDQNYIIVLDDMELGLKYRNDISEKFFNEWRDMNRIYKATDRKDQYLYDMEMLAVWHFGLGLQLRYFKLGNDLIKESADDPDSKSTNRTINSNVNTLIKNFLIYLDEINNEDAYSIEGKVELAAGIDKYFLNLIELYPSSNYGEMRKKAELMMKKSQSNEIKTSLEKLIELIDSK